MKHHLEFHKYFALRNFSALEPLYLMFKSPINVKTKLSKATKFDCHIILYMFIEKYYILFVEVFTIKKLKRLIF